MAFVEAKHSGGITTLTLSRGKVNALNDGLVSELGAQLMALENDRDCRAIVLTGRGKFFSFGFDIPEFLSFRRDEFTRYLVHFTDLYRRLFLNPKPVVAALNGHAIAGGCMLALACDCRVMATGKARISLNEIGFGSSVFAGSTEMLRFWTGSASATRVLYSGAMYSAQEAAELGLVDEVATEEELMARARERAVDLGAKAPRAFASIKSLLRRPVADRMMAREEASINEFVDIWYSEETWANLQRIRIY